MIRKIVQIDEAKCDGCGQCIPSCAEGAIALVGGKARLSADALCDGLGACLGECPQGAITVIERDAAAFDEAVVARHLEGLAAARPVARSGKAPHAAPPPPPEPAAHAGCPGSRAQVLPRRGLRVVSDPGGPPAAARRPADAGSPAAPGTSRLGQWPVQLTLVPPTAPYFQGADLLVAADCVPFAYARFHDELLDGKALVVGCPKLDDLQGHAAKLAQILTRSDVKSVTVVRMEVPCCGGISMATRHAIEASGKALPLRDVVVGIDGELRG